MKLYHDASSTSTAFAPGSWQAVAYKEIVAQLLSEERPFPCTFAVNGFRANELRFLFQEVPDVKSLGEQLAIFLKEARDIGPNPALLYFTGMRPVETIEEYALRFWDILNDLARTDEMPWPEDVPRDVNNPAWEFCFNGEPIFIVCTNPAHVRRQSRRSSTFALSFQPRWVFDKVLVTERAARIVFGSIRKRMAPYDAVPPSPALGRYKDAGVLESEQYVLSDDERIIRCPYMSLGLKEEV